MFNKPSVKCCMPYFRCLCFSSSVVRNLSSNFLTFSSNFPFFKKTFKSVLSFPFKYSIIFYTYTNILRTMYAIFMYQMKYCSCVFLKYIKNILHILYPCHIFPLKILKILIYCWYYLTLSCDVQPHSEHTVFEIQYL